MGTSKRGNRKVGEFLFVAQWQFYREFAITCSIYGVVVFLTSSTDAACFGDLYQWGRAKDGHESRTSGTTERSTQASAPRSILWLSLKALLAIAKLVMNLELQVQQKHWQVPSLQQQACLLKANHLGIWIGQA
jgi:hypothetical protein